MVTYFAAPCKLRNLWGKTFSLITFVSTNRPESFVFQPQTWDLDQNYKNLIKTKTDNFLLH